MAVGGGMALDQPAVPIRTKCGLGQISGYVVSDASEAASLQVDPGGANTNSVSSGWFAALAKKYPHAVKKASMGGANTPSVLEPERRFEDGAQDQGWTVIDFQVPPVSVTDWTPYVDEAQSKGVQALWPASDANMTPYFQAMTTAGYKPAFIALGTQFYNGTTTKAVAANPGLPPVYVATGWWPLELASQSPSTEQLIHVDAHLWKRRPRRLLRRRGRRVVAAVGQVRLGLRRRPDGFVCPEQSCRHRRTGTPEAFKPQWRS